MGITTSGIKESRAEFEALKKAIRRVTQQGVTHVLEQTQRQQKTLLSLGVHRRGTPTGSVAPNPPWRISGDLRASVEVEKGHRIAENRWMGRVGPSTRTPYGRIQELGGWTGRHHATKLPARPSLKPAWKVVRPTAGKTMARYWAEATRTVLH